jgi:hypothetical protein
MRAGLRSANPCKQSKRQPHCGQSSSQLALLQLVQVVFEVHQPPRAPLVAKVCAQLPRVGRNGKRAAAKRQPCSTSGKHSSRLASAGAQLLAALRRKSWSTDESSFAQREASSTSLPRNRRRRLLRCSQRSAVPLQQRRAGTGGQHSVRQAARVQRRLRLIHALARVVHAHEAQAGGCRVCLRLSSALSCV